MKKSMLIALAFLPVFAASAQSKKKNYDKVLSRAGDHIMLQVSSDNWLGTPDSIKSHLNNLSRGANAYVMLDKPFKGDPRMSVAFGVGVGTSSIYFKNMGVGINSNTTTFLPFINQDSLNHFKKYKLATSYLEVPVELRFSNTPDQDGKSIKGAIGIKVGTLLNAHTKGKSPEDKTNASINSYTEKIMSKRFINGTRLMATARVGYGHFSLFGSYQLNSIFKTGVAADIRVLQVGLCVSGL
jgi:hypothetical protein